MSTKIYNGYRLPGNLSIPYIARDLTERAIPVYEEAANQAVGITVALMQDRYEKNPNDYLGSALDILSYTNVEEKDYPLFEFLKQKYFNEAILIVDAIQNYLQKPNPCYVSRSLDLQMSVSFVGDPDPSGHFTYALLYCDNNEFRKVWEETPGVEEFAYWDNTDKPDSCTDAEWTEREQIWERVIGWDPPSFNGVSWTLTPTNALMLQVMPGIPDKYITVDRVLKTLLHDDAGNNEFIQKLREWVES